MRTKSLITVLVLAFLQVNQSAASAAVCGAANPRGGEAVEGTLTLDDRASTVRRDFRREGGTRTFQLVFDVANCDLRVPPEVTPGPVKDIDEEIPRAALGAPQVDALGDEVKVTYTVHAEDFDPGTYGSLIEVRDPMRITTARAPISLSRSERSFLVPGVIGFVAGAIGFFVFYWTKRFARYRLQVSRRFFLLAILFACMAGAIGAVFHWLDQDVWAWQENWRVAAGTAFAQSTAGVMVAMLAGVFVEEKGEPAREEKPRFRDRAAYHAEFWHAVFDAGPPAFIKVVEVDSEKRLTTESVHVAENLAFTEFQGGSVAGDQTDEERRVIKSDHQRGDELALAHDFSRQIESSDTYGMSSSRQIITFKKKLEYGGKTYIAGWYMPVELPPDLPAGDEIQLRAIGRIPVFRAIPAESGERTRVLVGKSSRRAAAG
jgi:hypothetical protein